MAIEVHYYKYKKNILKKHKRKEEEKLATVDYSFPSLRTSTLPVNTSCALHAGMVWPGSGEESGPARSRVKADVDVT